MIRMGRNSKPETSATPELPKTNGDYSQTNSPYNYSYQPQAAETTSFRSANETTSTSPASSAHNRAFSESESMARDIKEGRLSGFVGSGTTLTGETSFKAMLRVDGHLTGRVISESGTLIVGTSGLVDANVGVAAAVIHGTVNGDIIATERIELGRTAKVSGNIQTPSLMMEQGAILEGNCSMIKQKAEFEKRSAQKSQLETSINNSSFKTEAPVESPAETDVVS